MYFTPIKPNNWQVPSFLSQAPWNLDNAQSFNLIQFLLNTLRYQGAITYLLDQKIDLFKDDAFAPRQRELSIRFDKTATKDGVFSWVPTSFSNSRKDFSNDIL